MGARVPSAGAMRCIELIIHSIICLDWSCCSLNCSCCCLICSCCSRICSCCRSSCSRSCSTARTETRGRVSTAGAPGALPRRTWRRDGTVRASTEPSPIHKRPFALPCPASTTASTSSGQVRGSASSPWRSLNFAVYPVLRSSAPLLIHMDPVSGSGSSLVRIFAQTAKGEGSTPVFNFCEESTNIGEKETILQKRARTCGLKNAFAHLLLYALGEAEVALAVCSTLVVRPHCLSPLVHLEVPRASPPRYHREVALCVVTDVRRRHLHTQNTHINDITWRSTKSII